MSDQEFLRLFLASASACMVGLTILCVVLAFKVFKD